MAPIAEDRGTSIVDEGVPEAHRSMSIEKVFWSHFSPNFGPPTWMIGLLIASAGLDLWWGTLAIVLGNVIGTLPTAFSALMGPATGLTQIENSRFAFGRIGTRMPASINSVMCVGWVAVGNVPATLALVTGLRLAGLSMPFWLALVLLSALQLIVGVYGHHVVQVLEKYVGYVLVLAFGAIVVVANAQGGFTVQAHHPFDLAAFALALSVAASNAVSWAPYSSDYTRYVAKSTPKALVFGLVFVGLAGSGIAMEQVGFLTAHRITDTSPTGFINGIAALSGRLAPVVLLVIGLASVAGSAINTTTASYSLISAGIKMPRTLSAAIAGSLAYVLTIAGAGRFTSAYANYLILLLYWISPWIGIVLADWYFGWRSAGESCGGWRIGATIFAVVTPLTIFLFASTDLYTGPIAKLLGGLDVGYFVGFFAAAGAYVAFLRLTEAPAKAERHADAGMAP